MSRLKNKVKLLAITLSFLVSIQVVGVDVFQEEIEKDLTEEVVEVEGLISENSSCFDELAYTELDPPTYKENNYEFNVIEKSVAPSTPSVKYYILYQQLAYDKKSMITR